MVWVPPFVSILPLCTLTRNIKFVIALHYSALQDLNTYSDGSIVFCILVYSVREILQTCSMREGQTARKKVIEAGYCDPLTVIFSKRRKISSTNVRAAPVWREIDNNMGETRSFVWRRISRYGTPKHVRNPTYGVLSGNALPIAAMGRRLR